MNLTATATKVPTKCKQIERILHRKQERISCNYCRESVIANPRPQAITENDDVIEILVEAQNLSSVVTGKLIQV